MKKLVPASFHSKNAGSFLRSFASDRYYVFIGDHIPNPSDTIASEVVPSVKTEFDVYSNMLEGKVVATTDVSVMVPRNVFAAGKVYPEYTHLEERDTSIAVERGSMVDVYKCLDNNNGVAATVVPGGRDAAPITTADGYVWKYLFTVDTTTYDKFKTPSLMPFVANTVNEAAAVPASIDVIKIINGGVGYNNYFTGQFRTGDVVSGTSLRLIETASNATNFYKGCIIKITNPGSPAAGQFRRITAYTVSGQTKTITVSPAFSPSPATNDTYEIYPEVAIVSTGVDTVPAVARAIINPLQANTVSEVEILTPGAYHRSATATVVKDAGVTIISAAQLQPIVSPPSGHGGDPVTELGGGKVCVYSQIIDATTDLPMAGNFRQFGILKNPRFNNVRLTVSGTGFTNNEQIVQFAPAAQLSANAALSATSVTGNTSSTFLKDVRPGDSVVVANTTVSRVGTVASVGSNTMLTLKSDLGSMADGTLSLARLIADGNVASSNATSVTIKNGSPDLRGDSFVYGVSSKTSKAVTGITRNNSRSSFDGFVQAVTLTGTMTTGSQFTAGETVTQGANSMVVYHATSTKVYGTNQVGKIGTGNLTGSQSGAVMNVTTKYEGDLASDSGHFVYVENVVPVNRSATKSETFKIVLEF